MTYEFGLDAERFVAENDGSHRFQGEAPTGWFFSLVLFFELLQFGFVKNFSRWSLDVFHRRGFLNSSSRILPTRSMSIGPIHPWEEFLIGFTMAVLRR